MDAGGGGPLGEDFGVGAEFVAYGGVELQEAGMALPANFTNSAPLHRLLIQPEGIMDGAGGVLDVDLVDGDGDLDFRGGDHADVDAFVPKGLWLQILSLLKYGYRCLIKPYRDRIDGNDDAALCFDDVGRTQIEDSDIITEEGQRFRIADGKSRRKL